MTNEELFAKLEAGDESVRELIVVRNRPLIMMCAKQFPNFQDPVVNYEELFACGEVGLVKAMNAYKLEKGIMFSTYATKCITNEMRMAIRQFHKHEHTYSLNDLVGEEISFIDTIVDERSNIERDILNRSVLDSAIKALVHLTPREREVMALVIQSRGTIEQWKIAKQIGLSQPQVSRIVRRAQKKLEAICR
jgi:RNA polymerase sporulation-specific sigma factor